MTSETEPEESTDDDTGPPGPESFSRQFHFRRYRARWQERGDGGEWHLRVRRQRLSHHFREGYRPRGPAVTVFGNDERTAREVYEVLGVMLGRREPYEVAVDGYAHALDAVLPDDADETDVDWRLRKAVMDAVRDAEFDPAGSIPPSRVAQELRFVADRLDDDGYDVLGGEIDVE